MASIKFGLSQVSQQTPAIYSRIETAVVVILIPAVTAFIISTVIDKTKQTTYIAALVLLSALIKAIGSCLGVTDVSTSSTTTTTENTPK